MIWIPFVGAIAEATGMTLEKKILRKSSINYKNYVVYGFLALVLVMLPLIFFFWRIGSEAYLLINILIFLLVIITSILANVLVIYAFKKEKVTEIEPIRLMQPLFTILLAFILSFFFEIYSNERRYSILLLAVIASGSLVATHIKKHHLVYDKYVIAALLGSFFFALELVISRSILPHYSLITFYFLRCLSVFLITLIIFRPKAKLKNKTKFLILIVGAIWVFYRLILYYGYLTYGVVFTTVLFILGPIFIFIFARIFLNEKITWRHIVSSIIIILCIITAIIIRF